MKNVETKFTRSTINSIWYLRTFIVVFLTSVAHRFFSYTHLGSVDDLYERIAFFCVGSLSDLWVACLWSLLAFLLATGSRRPSIFHIPANCLYIGLAAVHQGYTQFFGHQILPFHLRYIFDTSFIEANKTTLVSSVPIVIVGLGISFFILISFRISPGRIRFPGLWVVGAILLSLLAHNRNIHYRVQLFVPSNLQTNGLEKLYLNFKQQRPSNPLTQAQQQILGLTDLKENVADYESFLLQRPASPEKMLEPGRTIVEKASELKSNNELNLVVVLMESQRPADTGFYTNEKESLTPQLDKLARTGVVFNNAFATSNVTRGAQEAVLCGLRSSMSTSMMQGAYAYNRPCIPDLLSDSGFDTWFVHGGDGRFDNQEAFWKKHKFKNVLTQTDFSERPGPWGVSDRVLMDRALTVSAANGNKFALVLTVSNHIPWNLPDDASESTKSGSYSHPSYRTTTYADEALGHFVNHLKVKEIWQNTLLIVLSDHGNLVPARYPRYTERKSKDPWLLTHINLILSGGVVESSWFGERNVDRFVSQVDVASFIASILDLKEFAVMGKGLFATESLPVVADLGRDLFDPVQDEVFTNATLDETSNQSIIHYLGYLHLVKLWSLDQAGLMPLEAEK